MSFVSHARWRLITGKVRTVPTQLEKQLTRIARRRTLTIVIAALVPLVLRALLLAVIPPPEPRIHDEFSHLLLADTLSQGRLVNPVHPLSVHFETMHVLVRPVYASVFPVAQGFAMAIGQVLTGSPWMGVWLSIAFLCGAVCWMLQGWAPPAWALLGAAIVVARFGVLSYWMDSYYGGAVAAAGGALLLGGLGRALRRHNWRDPAIMGVGLAILANSRPYEGAVFALPALAALIWVLVNKRRRWITLAPMLLVLLAAGVSMGIYFSRFNGNPLQLPYSFYRSTVTAAPHFIWQSPRPEPVFHHRVLWQFHMGWEMDCYRDAAANRPPHGLLDKARSYTRFYLGPFLAIPIAALLWFWRSRRVQLLLAAAALMSIALAVEVWHAPHYAAPALGLMMLLVIEGLRRIRVALGLRWVRVLAAACLLLPVVDGSGQPSDGTARARIVQQLEAGGGRNLVLVRYSIAHDPGDEWVYNAADIDNAPIVWAREMDMASNARLLGYFKQRQVWLVRPDVTPVRLEKYDAAMPPDPPQRFVKLGTQAIEGLRSPEEVRRKVLARAGPEHQPFTCDQWSYLFRDATGIESPDVAHGCFAPGQRAQAVSFEDWFQWLEQQP